MIQKRIAMVVMTLLLGYLYLYPALNPIFQGRVDTVMSDNTDPAALPYQYEEILDVWKENPSRFFYGAIYSESFDPEMGFAYWMAWSERWFVVLLSYFLPLEQISTGVVFSLMMLNVLCMYGLCRYLGWSRSVSYGLGIAWAFCAFTRARAKVHMSMAGIYHVPLIFLGLFLVVRGKSWRSAALAAGCFLLSVMTVHYFIVTSAFLSLFFLGFLFLQKEFWLNWKKSVIRLLVAVAPAVLFLGHNFINTIPSDVKMSADKSVPETGKMPDGRPHPFLYTYAAKPIDYLTGDLSLEFKPNDLNPIRYLVNQHVQENLREGNLHERTNGIRWVILFLGLGTLIFTVFKKSFRAQIDSRNIFFFGVFGFFAFWLSLSPDSPFDGWGPSGWLYSLVSQIRVTNRAGVFAHFSLLMIVGFFFASLYKSKWKSWLLKPALFPALMVLDYPPLVQHMPMAPIAPAYSNLTAGSAVCGTGMYFPYISTWTDVAFYHFLQKLRGTDCDFLNGAMDPAQIRWLSERFPPSIEFIRALDRLPAVRENLVKMAACVPLHWLVFDQSVPASFQAQACNDLGWILNPNMTCVDPKPHRTFEKWPDRCLN